MNFVYQAKVVGLNFHKVQNAVEQGDYVILVADTENPVDSDAIAVYNGERELVGYIANSDKTLSPNNRRNGNISATELKGNLDFSNREYYGEIIRVYKSCIYLEVNEGKWSYIQPVEDVSTVTFSNTVDIDEPSEIEALKSEVESLKALVVDLQDQVANLKTIVTIGGEDNSSPKTSDGRTLYSVVGLSHFEGQNHLGYELSIEQVTVPVNDLFAEVVFLVRSGSYERRNILKLVDAFDKANKLSYGSLKSFVDYVYNSIRYYTNSKAVNLLKEVVITINRYLEYNYYFLS